MSQRDLLQNFAQDDLKAAPVDYIFNPQPKENEYSVSLAKEKENGSTDTNHDYIESGQALSSQEVDFGDSEMNAALNDLFGTKSNA